MRVSLILKVQLYMHTLLTIYTCCASLKGRGLGGSLLRGQRTQVTNEYVLYAVKAPSCEGSATLILLQLNNP